LASSNVHGGGAGRRLREGELFPALYLVVSAHTLGFAGFFYSLCGKSATSSPWLPNYNSWEDWAWTYLA
jgi:hypothetical protein